MSFCDLGGNMDHAEELLKYLINHAMTDCSEDLNLFTSFVDKGLKKVLETLVNESYERVSYDDAVDILLKSGKEFQYKVERDCDLQSEHERFLAEEYFKKPVFLMNYPKSIKPFYMRANDDGRTVAAWIFWFRGSESSSAEASVRRGLIYLRREWMRWSYPGSPTGGIWTPGDSDLFPIPDSAWDLNVC